MNWTLIISFGTIATTFIGFIVTYRLTKQNLKNEINKTKAQIGLEKMEDVPFKLLQMLDEVKDGKLSIETYSQLMYTVYAYGSSDAINIATSLQRFTYENKENPSSFRPLTLLSLLISQIKYDLTAEIISPENWFILKISDYAEKGMDQKVKGLINEDVKRLNLKQAFLIK